jgi:predicted HicB family RNase H-like nuclease
VNNLLEYKGFCGTVEFSDADSVLFGKVIGANGLISYEGDSVQTLRADFEEAVDDYLELCAIRRHVAP